MLNYLCRLLPTCCVVQWCNGKYVDEEVMDVIPLCYHVDLCKCVNTSATKQYNLVLVTRWWCSAMVDVTTDLWAQCLWNRDEQLLTNLCVHRTLYLDFIMFSKTRHCWQYIIVFINTIITIIVTIIMNTHRSELITNFGPEHFSSLSQTVEQSTPSSPACPAAATCLPLHHPQLSRTSAEKNTDTF